MERSSTASINTWLAWREALDQEGIELSVWRIHRKIGMSGGLFTNMLLRETGLDIEEARIERLRRLHAEAFNARYRQVRPLPGARELTRYPHAKAASRGQSPPAAAWKPAGRVLESLEIDLARIPVITRDMVKYAKPDPDLFLAAADALKWTSRPHALSATASGHAGRPRAGALGVGPPFRRIRA